MVLQVLDLGGLQVLALGLQVVLLVLQLELCLAVVQDLVARLGH